MATTVSNEFYQTLRSLRIFSDNLASICALVANAIFIALLYYVRVGLVRRYALVMAVISSADILLTAVMLLQRSYSTINDVRLITFISGPLSRLPGSVGIYLPHFLSSLFLMHLNLSPPLLFIYRYRTLINGKSMTNRTIFTYYVINLLLSTAQAVAYGLALMKNEADTSIACEKFYRKFPLWRPTADKHFTCVAIRLSDPMLTVSVLQSLVYSIASFGVMSYCTVHLLWYLHVNASKMSAQTLKLQRQLNAVLIAQMVQLLFMEFIPFILGPLSIETGKASMMLMIVDGAALSWLPFLGPAITIILVGPYRRAICETLTATYTALKKQLTSPKTATTISEMIL